MGYTWSKNIKWNKIKVKIAWRYLGKNHLRTKLNLKGEFIKIIWDLKKRFRLLDFKYLRYWLVIKGIDVLFTRNLK